jgi:hypothetical protein
MTELREREDHSWFKVQAVPVFRFDCARCCRVPLIVILTTDPFRLLEISAWEQFTTFYP